MPDLLERSGHEKAAGRPFDGGDQQRQRLLGSVPASFPRQFAQSASAPSPTSRIRQQYDAVGEAIASAGEPGFAGSAANHLMGVGTEVVALYFRSREWRRGSIIAINQPGPT